MEIADKLFKGIKFLFNEEYRKKILIWNGYYDKMDDEKYLKMRYKLAIGKTLDLDNPQTFNEKMQWLKLYNRKPEYTMMVDKYKVRDYIAEQLGEEYLIPLLGVWDDPEEIDFESLPNQFVLKCNHNSGRGMCICKDKSKLNIMKVKEELRKGLEENYYLTSREWPYKDVPRRIICEKYMTDETGTELKDYKIHNFAGEPKIIEVDFDRFKSHKRNLYSVDWKYIEDSIGYPNDSSHQIKKPEKLEEMLKCARKLSEKNPYMRTDFYSIDNRIYFGEITFFHDGGWGSFSSEEFEQEFSSWLKLPGGGYLLKAEGYLIYIRSIEDKSELRDYKFYCFDGKVKLLGIYSDRNKSCPTKADYFDEKYQWVDITWGYQHAEVRPKKPEKFQNMIEIAEKLAQNIPLIRVDLYSCGEKIYFGELTFFDGSGFDKIEPVEWDYKLGSWIKLPSITK